MMNTDKNETGLFKEYEEQFLIWKELPVKYLEIGIRGGDSLRWAKEYFTKGKVLGIDIRIPDHIDDVTMFKINQNDSEKLVEVGAIHGPFDIIIDDGAHMRKETANTFMCLFPYLNPGGVYIIEDWMSFLMDKKYAGMDELMLKLIVRHGGHIVKLKDNTGSYAIIRK